MRVDGRKHNELRPFEFERDFTEMAPVWLLSVKLECFVRLQLMKKCRVGSETQARAG